MSSERPETSRQANEAPHDANDPLCPLCGDAVPCGSVRGDARCWCMEHPAPPPDPALPPDACLCERCLKARLAERAGR